jgi:HSP20 family protein
MNIIRWEPFNGLTSVRQAMDSLLDEALTRTWHPSDMEHTLVPPVDMVDNEKDIVVKAVLPGVAQEDVSIDITGDMLTIRGETKTDKEEKKEDYIYRESRYGTFVRSIALPEGLKTDKAEAEVKDGILTVTLPKAAIAKPKTIKVTLKNGEKKTAKAAKAVKSKK